MLSSKEDTGSEVNRSSIPNLVTSSRIIGSLCILIFTIIDPDPWIVGLIYVLAISSDKLDGYLARRLKSETELGKTLEPIADAMLIYAIFTFLTFRRDFPMIIFQVSILVLFVGIPTNLIMYLKKKKWYVPNLMSAKAMIGITHAVGLAYFFQIPYRVYLLYLMLFIGLVTLCIYSERLFSYGSEQEKGEQSITKPYRHV